MIQNGENNGDEDYHVDFRCPACRETGTGVVSNPSMRACQNDYCPVSKYYVRVKVKEDGK